MRAAKIGPDLRLIRYIAENVAPRAASIQEIEEVSAEDKEITRLRKCVHTSNW